jgi:hypothetical protein
MRKDLDELEIEFNINAREAFYKLFARFETTVNNLDRRRDENVFQHTQAKFLATLKSDLESLAISIFEKYRGMTEINHLKRNLTNRINEYVQEFRMKSQAL